MAFARCEAARTAAPDGSIALRRGGQAVQALVLRGGFRQRHERQPPPEAAREASREPDGLLSCVGVESAQDGLLDPYELAPLRDHPGVARSIGQLGHRKHVGIVREHVRFGHGARYASATRRGPQSRRRVGSAGGVRSHLRDGESPGCDWSLSPMSGLVRRGEDGRMEPGEDLSRRASELVEDARRFRSAAAQPGCHIAVPDTLVSLEEALLVLSAAWYQVAADASPGIVERRLGPGSEALSAQRRDRLSRGQEVRLMGTLHDVAAGFARCANACQEGRSAVTAIIARRAAAAGRADARRHGSEFPRFQRHDRPGQRVA
jgi:hypothetical protein